MDKPAVLFILSAKHCDPELQAEFGSNIPACMVPIGPNRLIDLQMRKARQSIKNLQRTFVALPDVRFSPDEDKWPDDMQVVSVSCSVSMGETFDNLLSEFRSWCKKEQMQSVFDTDEWVIHFINGDTLVTDTESWQRTVITYVNNPDIPFEMSKEFNVFHVMQPRPTAGSEYVGKGAFLFSHKAIDADPLHYGSYGNIVRSGEPRRIIKDWWLDFGHAETYFRSKRSLMSLSARAFNQVQLDPYTGFISKIGDDKKIEAEYEWYRNVPAEVAMYAPRVKRANPDRCTSFMYEMDYVPCPTLAELMVYGNHSASFWSHISKKLVELLVTLEAGAPKDFMADDGMLMQKTRERCLKLGTPWREYAFQMIDWLNGRIQEHPAVVHGDLCFSNILYDRRSDMLKVIDPRGYNTVNGVYGNQMYDLAKLYHSAAGYDFQVAGLSVSEDALANCAVVAEAVEKYAKERDIGAAELTCATALLFYSMLPLHAEDMDRVHRLMFTGNDIRASWMQICNDKAEKIKMDSAADR